MFINLTTDSENRTRRHWLFSAFCLFTLYPLALPIFFSLPPKDILMTENVLMAHLFEALYSILFFLLFWYCTYWRYGTKLLTFWLILSSVGKIELIMKGLKEGYNAWTITFVLIDIAIFAWWFLMGLQMRKVNKTVQEKIARQKLISKPRFQILSSPAQGSLS